LSSVAAAREVGHPRITLRNWSLKLVAGGEPGLERGYHRSGRKQKVTLNAAEKKTARKFALKTESTPMGIELMADSEVCRPEVREVIAGYRQTGCYPRSLMRQVRVTSEEMAAARGAEDLRSVAFSVRRGMFGYDDEGAWVPVNSGDIVEFDDVSTDVPFFWQDPDGYWRVGRQILMARDVRSGKWLGVYPVARFGDSYRGEDIARFIELLVRRWGRFGRLRLERGRWENNAVDGIRVHADGSRWGGISSVIRVDHVFASTAKGGIESAFRPFHKIMGVYGVRIGKTRGEYEQATDDMMAVNAQKADPRKCGFIPWGEELIHKLVKGCQFLNRRVRRCDGLPPEAPDVTWARDMATIGGTLPAVGEQDFWMFKPTIRMKSFGVQLPGHVQVKVETYPTPFRFHAATQEVPFIERGHRIIARFDPLMPEAGCALFNFESRPMNRENWKRFQFIGVAPWAAGEPQFSDWSDYVSPAIAARKLRTAQVRASFAAIEPGGRAAVVHLESDGRGNVLRTEVGGRKSEVRSQKPTTLHDPLSERAAEGRTANERALPNRANPIESGALDISTRGTETTADDSAASRLRPPNSPVPRGTFDRAAAADYIARREAEARARGELIET